MGARGEAVIQAGERGEITVLFTNRALSDAESFTGRSIFSLARGLVDGQSGVTEVAQLLRAGMQSARRDARERPFAVSVDTAFAILDAAGVKNVMVALAEAVTTVIAYDGERAAGEPSGPDDETDPN
jgi:hypothetical protein